MNRMMRWDPFRDFVGWPHLAKATHASNEALTAADWAPAVDIVETPEEYQVKAELPEVKKEDVKVALENGVLRIAGERRMEKEERGKKYHRVERSYGSFIRTFALPEDVDEQGVQAEFKDGLLNVRMPKNHKGPARAIDVKVS